MIISTAMVGSVVFVASIRVPRRGSTLSRVKYAIRTPEQRKAGPMQRPAVTDDLALVVPFGIDPGMSLSPGIEETLGRVSLRMTSTLELDAVLAEITRGLVLELQAALARIWLLGPGDL